MSRPPIALLLRHLGPWAAERWDDADSDRELLRHFAVRRDEAAFAALVRRHGPMVLSVCRRILHQAQDAEDAFQATFLVLFRKAESRLWRDSVGGWLHRVAARIALRLRARRTMTSSCHSENEDIVADPLERLTVRELLAAFDEELARLPERYREPLVLCYLEGKTQEEAARQLGRSLSTVRRRLEGGRKLLHQRLTRRGLELPEVLGAVLLSRDASAVVPAPLQKALAKAVEGSCSTRVAFLAQGALQALGTARLKTVMVLVVALGMLATGAGWMACGVLAQKREEPAPAVQAPRAEAAQPPLKDYYGDPLPPGVVARMGSVQMRHGGGRIAFAPDGKTLISTSWDGTIRAWDVTTGRQVRQTSIGLPSRPGSPVRLNLDTLSPDGKLVGGFSNDALHLFDTATGKEWRQLPGAGIGHSHLCYSADGKWLATLIGIADNYTIRVWDAAAGKERLCLRRLSQAHSLLLSSDGRLLAYGQGDEIHIVDTSTRRELYKGPVGGLGWTFSPDARLLATSTREGEVTLWQTEGLKKLAILQPSAAVTGRIIHTPRLCFSPDGKLLAVGGLEILVVWDVAGRKERLRLADRTANEIVFSPDGKTLACAGKYEIRLWDVASGQRLHPRAGHDNYVRSVAVSPDGKTVASAADDPVVHVWDAATGKPLGSARHDSSASLCAFAADGRLLVSGGFGVVRLLDASNGKELRRFVVKDLKSGQQNHGVLVAHLSPDGSRLAVVSEGKAGQLTVWDARTGERLACRPFSGSLDTCFSPDGERVSVSGRERLTIQDTLSGAVRETIPGDLGGPVAFSPDGKVIAVGIHESQQGPGPGGYRPLGIRVAEVVTGQELFRVEGWIDFAAISPDGRRLVTAAPDGLRLWDVRTGELLLRRKWPKDAAPGPLLTAIYSLAFLPDSRRLVTGMNDGTLLVWDLGHEARPKADLARHLDRKQLEAAWSDLAGDARKAHRAIYTLAATPEQAVPFLEERLRPVAAVDAKRVDTLVEELDSDEYRVREAAARRLEDMGTQIEPALRRVLENMPPLETRKRVRAIQDRLHGVPPAETLRVLRAERVLEGIGTPAARQLLAKLATGAAGARETTEARAALARLQRGSSSSP